MAIGTLSSRVLGFVRDAVFFALFPKTFTDAYSVAFKLPNLFRRVLGEGSLSVSFVPIYVGSSNPKALSDAVFSWLLALTLTLSFLAILFMDPLVSALVGDPMGYAAVAGKMALTIQLARVMMVYLILVALYAFYTAISNTRGFFLLPAVGPTCFNVASIGFFLLAWGISREWAAWGVVVGGLVQASLVGWLLWREEALPRWTFQWRGVGLGPVLRGMVPGLFGLGLFQVLTLVNTRYAASILEEGAQSYLYAADRVLELPQSLLAVSLGSVLLPRLAELAQVGDRDGVLKEVSHGIRVFLFLALPAALGMALLSERIVSVLFERGAFGAEDVGWTAAIVEEYAVLLIFAGLTRITAPAFYAYKNLRVPALVALIVLVVHVNLAPWFMARWGLAGLAACTSLSAFLNFIFLQMFFLRFIGGLPWRSLMLSALRWLPGLVLLALIAQGLPPFLSEFPSWMVLLVTILSAVLAYLSVAKMLDCRELEWMLRGLGIHEG